VDQEHSGLPWTTLRHVPDTEDNWCQSPNASFHNDKWDSDGHQPESSTGAAKRITRLSTKKTGSSMRKTEQRGRSGLADLDESEPDSNPSSATKVVRALDSSFTPSPWNQPSAPPTDLGIRPLRCGRHIGRETNLKKVFRLSVRMAFYTSGKHHLAALVESDERKGPAAEHLGRVARGIAIIDSSIEGEPDRLPLEVNRSRHPTVMSSPPNSPPLLAPNPSHHLASAAFEQLPVRPSAQHLLMLASGAQQPAATPATQLGRPSRSHSLSIFCAYSLLVDMAAADAGRKSGSAASS